MVDSKQALNVDINNIATDLNNKLDRDFTNINDTLYISAEFLNLFMPDYSKGTNIISYTSSSNQFEVTAPGYISVSKNLNGGIYINDIAMVSTSSTSYGGDSTFFPVGIGDKVYFTGGLSLATYYPLRGVK